MPVLQDLTTNIASQSDGNEYEKNGRFTSDNVQASVPPNGAVYKNNTAHYKSMDSKFKCSEFTIYYEEIGNFTSLYFLVL